MDLDILPEAAKQRLTTPGTSDERWGRCPACRCAECVECLDFPAPACGRGGFGCGAAAARRGTGGAHSAVYRATSDS
jgi:hypothetical protein